MLQDRSSQVLSSSRQRCALCFCLWPLFRSGNSGHINYTNKKSSTNPKSLKQISHLSLLFNMNRPIQFSVESVRPRRRNPFSLQTRTRRTIRGNPADRGRNFDGNRSDLLRSVRPWRSNDLSRRSNVETSDETPIVAVDFVTYPNYLAVAGGPSLEDLKNPFPYPTTEEVSQFSSTSASNYNRENGAESLGAAKLLCSNFS